MYSLCWAREADIVHLSIFDKYSWSVMKGISTTIAAGAGLLAWSLQISDLCAAPIAMPAAAVCPCCC